VHVPRPDDGSRDRAGRFERLLLAGSALTPELDLQTALDRILEAARDLTGARYAALGVLDEHRPGFERFLTVDLDDDARDSTGALPQHHDGSGPLFDAHQLIRNDDLIRHPSSAELPASNAPTGGFLEAPITVRGRAWGNLYLTEKDGGQPFDDDDADAITVLAGWVGMAIDNARLLDETTKHRDELAHALRTMHTAMEIATAIGSDTDLSRILELIARRARALVDADGLLIWLRDGDQLRIAAVAGDADVRPDAAVPVDASTAGAALWTGQGVRVQDARTMPINPELFGRAPADSTLIVPLVHRGRGLGVLVAFDRRSDAFTFDADNQRALDAFAASAATAVATARLVGTQRLQDSIAAAESERGRWARELHDETLQGLASLKLALAGALTAEPDRARTVIQGVIEQIGHDISALRRIIADLRPAALDELGLEPALHTLCDSVTESQGLEVRVSTDLGATRLPPDVETVVYRVAQESLTNVVKHAGTCTVDVDVHVDDDRLRLVVADDGCGIDGYGEGTKRGYGLAGMRERAELAFGAIAIAPRLGGGTQVTLELPLTPPPRSAGFYAD
jgi:signal transduction histidine kinase